MRRFSLKVERSAFSRGSIILLLTCSVNTSQGNHLLSKRDDLAEVVSHVEGAVVVTRPDLTRDSDMPMADNKLDYSKTLESYFPLFRSSLLPR